MGYSPGVAEHNAWHRNAPFREENTSPEPKGAPAAHTCSTESKSKLESGGFSPMRNVVSFG